MDTHLSLALEIPELRFEGAGIGQAREREHISDDLFERCLELE